MSPRPKRLGTSRRSGAADPNPVDIRLGPTDTPAFEQDLTARSSEVVRVPIDQLEPDEELLSAWNRAVIARGHIGFEHRVLLGLAINAMRPSHGRVTEYTACLSASLGRSGRWVRETTRVASVVELARDQGVFLPPEIRDIAWRSVPGAIENLRNGRALDWTAPEDVAGPSAEVLEARVAKSLGSLVKALQAVEDTGSRGVLVKRAMARLEQLALATVDAVSEPGVDEDGGSEPSAGPAPPVDTPLRRGQHGSRRPPADPDFQDDSQHRPMFGRRGWGGGHQGRG